MKKEKQLTEKQFINKFKKKGFELYKTKDVKPKLDVYYSLKEITERVLNE